MEYLFNQDSGLVNFWAISILIVIVALGFIVAINKEEAMSDDEEVDRQVNNGHG